MSEPLSPSRAPRPSVDRIRWIWLAATLSGVAVLAALHFIHLPHGPDSSICIFRRATGIPCPGCGMTRAFAAMARGEWRAAIEFHPLAPILGIEFLALWLAWGREAFRRSFEAREGEFVFGVRSERLAHFAIANGAALLALWFGRLATGTLPW